MNLVGSRYVFFKSLPSDHPMRAVGESALSSIRSKLNEKKEEDTSLDQHMNNMGTYINFIHDMMLSARTNEIKFLEQ